jgi:polar amino acid transport system substrate-binding protein
MKQKNILIRFGICIFLLFQVKAYSADTKSFTIGWEPWRPYQFKNDKGQLTGLDVELVKAIIQEMNGTIKYTELPWRRLLAYVKLGTYDLAAGASKTSERQAYAFFSNFYRTESNVLFVLKGTVKKFPFAHLSDIKNTGFQLGITNGYYYGKTFAKLLEDPTFKKHVQGVPSDSVNIKKVLRNRINGFIGDMYAGVAALKKAGVRDRFEMHPVPVSSAKIHIMFSKKSCTQKDVDQFNKALKKLQEKGNIKRIMRKYRE